MKTTFGNITPGDAFYYDGTLYIKTEAITDSDEYGSYNYNCIIADTGSHQRFDDVEEIETTYLGVDTRKYE